MTQMSVSNSYAAGRAVPPQLSEAPTPLLREADALAAEISQRIAMLNGEIQGFVDKLLGCGPVSGETGSALPPQPPGDLYRLLDTLRGAHAAMTATEAAFRRLQAVA